MPCVKVREYSASSSDQSYGKKLHARVGNSGFYNFFNRIAFLLCTVNSNGFVCVAIGLLILEAFISLQVVWRVPYTEIDWSTYMQQVKSYLNGEKNYSRIEGDTGPIVYPAGHLYIFRLLYSCTQKGKSIRTAQYLFVCFYLINLALVFRLFHKSRRIPPFVLFLVCLTSYRIHSIFMLRLFNDPIAMLILFAAANLWLSQQWLLGSILFSISVSVKMNVLLFAPAVFFIFLLSNKVQNTIYLLSVCALVQVAVAWEFLLYDPISYVKRAFELSRVFMFKWTVNFRFLPEALFLNKYFHIALLVGHICCVALFMWRMWFRSQGGLGNLLTRLSYGIKTRLDAHEVIYALFTANLIGIAFARSLHYQFYSWYYHSLSYLLFSPIFQSVGANDERKNWSQPILSVVPIYSIIIRVAILLGIEYCWNVYPSTVFSSSLIHLLHITIIALLFWNRDEDSLPRVKKN
uniref:dolichyl-P-Man:Man5GlcNAc2-PP-dolichol alpha-1,3-mannosyltransferase n=1 Tax=Ditylenchus dipsaci TaxID=166011 RepID=A0A915E9J8_9BILA